MSNKPRKILYSLTSKEGEYTQEDVDQIYGHDSALCDAYVFIPVQRKAVSNTAEILEMDILTQDAETHYKGMAVTDFYKVWIAQAKVLIEHPALSERERQIARFTYEAFNPESLTPKKGVKLV